MKKVALFLIAIYICVVSASSATVFCQISTPHVVIKGEVWMLAPDSDERLFLLPEGYYSKITAIDEGYYHITFNGVKGRVVKAQVETLGYHTEAKDTSMEIGISEEYSEFNSISLKAYPSLSSVGIADIPCSSVFTYLGSFPTESGMWYYVRYGESYGYIRSDRTIVKEMQIPEFVPEEPPIDNDAEDVPTASESDTSPAEEDGKSKALRIILIVGLSIPAVLIVVLLFKPIKTDERIESD